MPADLIVTDLSVAPAPKETPVPAASRYIIKQVQALYTDNGAGGAWLPALEIVSDAGIVTGRYVGESVAAGAGQEVTFFPLGRKGVTATPSTSGGLPNAVMIKTNSQTVLGNHVSQITLDSSTFATTDASVFSASGSNIVIAADGLYASYCYFVPDTTDPDPAQTELFAEWITAGGGANAPWEQIVPRNFNVNGPAGLPGFQPTGAGLLHSIGNLAFAYCSAQPTSVKVFLATLDASNVDLSTCLHIVVQLQAISAADLAGFPSFPL